MRYKLPKASPGWPGFVFVLFFVRVLSAPTSHCRSMGYSIKGSGDSGPGRNGRHSAETKSNLARAIPSAHAGTHPSGQRWSPASGGRLEVGLLPGGRRPPGPGNRRRRGGDESQISQKRDRLLANRLAAAYAQICPLSLTIHLCSQTKLFQDHLRLDKTYKI